MAERIRPSDKVVQENIKKWGIPQPDRDYTVLIHCTTYNHGKYIKDALEGFVMQKCSYSFCAIIIDDCSTDNNAEIIREYAEKYPDIIKPILLGENHMQRGILRDPYIEKWHQCAKYIAQCEGDDYWIDPYKLQKQVDFLEEHPDYGMVHSYFQYVNADKSLVENPEKLYVGIRERVRDGYIWGDYLRLRSGGYILTCTTCIRMPLKKERHFFDIGSFMGVARTSKVFCLKEETAAYRRNINGAMRSSPSNYYINLTYRVWLYQLYYYHTQNHDAFYESDKETKLNRSLATIHVLIQYFKRVIPGEDKCVLRKVLQQEMPNLLRNIPLIFFNKLKRC